MAILTLTVAESSDDAYVTDLAYDATTDPMAVGGVTTTPLTNYGQGWRFTNVQLGAGDIVTSAVLRLMKSGATWTTVNLRLAAIAEDNTATFSAGSPPGSRPITTNIAVESPNNNHADGTVYDYPPDSAQQIVLGAAIQEVINRGGWGRAAIPSRLSVTPIRTRARQRRSVASRCIRGIPPRPARNRSWSSPTRRALIRTPGRSSPRSAGSGSNYAVDYSG